MSLVIYKNGSPTYYSPRSAQYCGDKTGEEFRDWVTFGSDPNDFITCTYGTLVQRCVTLYHTSAIARACVNKPTSYAIGDGLVFKSEVDHKALGMTRKQAEKWQRTFTSLLHIEKQLSNYYEKQAQLFREAKISGDAFLYLLREENSMLDMPFDLIAVGGGDIDWQKSGKNIKLGIKTDTYGRRKAFYRCARKTPVKFMDSNGNINALQMMFRERPQQLRGLSCYYSEIARFKNIDRFWDAVLERVVQEAIQLGYFQASDTNVAAQARAMARRSMSAAQRDGDTQSSTSSNSVTRSDNMKTGGMYWLGNEESMQFTELKTPSNNFGMFNEWSVKMACMAVKYPPEFILGEYSTSFTAHKGALNDAIRQFMSERKTFERTVDYAVNLEYLKHFIRTGQIETPKGFWESGHVRRASIAGVTLGPVPGHVNPLQEVKADIAAVEAGLTTRSSMAAKFGHDWYNMIDKWKTEQIEWFNQSLEKMVASLGQDLVLKGEENASGNNS
jgi:hypothetical protein